MNNPITPAYARAIRAAQRCANKTDRIVYVVSVARGRFKVTGENRGDVWICLIPDSWRF